MMMIMLTKEEAAKVRGASATDPLAALEPMPEPDGDRWMLPVLVLEDPAHTAHYAFLASRPREDIAPPEPELEP